MCVGPVGGVGGVGGGISPLLIEQYKRLNREMKKKRLAAKEGVDPLVNSIHSEPLARYFKAIVTEK